LPQFTEGEKANFTILDLELVWTVDKFEMVSKSINTPFDKKLLRGKAIAAINNQKMFIDGKFMNI
ncbi:MAG: hypothetical protein R3321_13150, partial [Nitrososphaeraceae archaeon]|nr:hypothetical protein [Nitrososphaeraceae archaeon]